MKYAISFLALLVSPLALAQIYIDYPDGTTYTVKEGENVFVTPAEVYIKNSYQDGGVFFKRIHPSTRRDSTYTDPVEEQYQVGSHEWCKNYVPWSEGLTFSMMSWQRYCDTNNDGVYDADDAGYGGLGFGG